MDEGTRRIRQAAVREWQARGLFRPGASEQLERELAASGGAGPDPAGETSFGAVALYSLAGALAIAAVFALLELSDLRGAAPAAIVAAVGFSAFCAAALLHRALPGPWVEALGVVAAVGLAVAQFMHEPLGRMLAPLALLGGLALPWLSGRWSLLPLLAVAVFTLGGYQSASLYFGREGFILRSPTDAAATLWLLLQAVYTVLAPWVARARSAPWWSGFAGACALALVAPIVLFIGEVVRPSTPGLAELCVAVPEAALLAAGFRLRSRGLVVGSALVLAVDAIVFAFDINRTFGILALLLVAGSLIALAGLMRRRPEAFSG